jgi:hypothetical protein
MLRCGSDIVGPLDIVRLIPTSPAKYKNQSKHGDDNIAGRATLQVLIYPSRFVPVESSDLRSRLAAIRLVDVREDSISATSQTLLNNE